MKKEACFPQRFIIRILLVLVASQFLLNEKISGQTSWNLTNDFTGGPKTGIIFIQNSILMVGLTNGIMKSPNEWNNYNLIFETSAIYTLLKGNSNTIFAGGSGKIYISDDIGKSWDSASIDFNFPVIQIIKNHMGELFALTGKSDSNGNYESKGVFYSGDRGIPGVIASPGLTIMRVVRISLSTRTEDYT